MTDRGKRVNGAGHTAEPTVRREIPWTDGNRAARRDEATARESRRRATTYGRARGRS